ncbi:protein dipZ [Mycobacterium ulcerans str. Harvey]|uniref:Protein dipZ n=1 Tax=Mycobacterium ulcerans str. Harvey TaxID=1299332 RepID=A0ABP3AK62_MYCUL|nr:protein dipZ [Mycobacterium ulcerans str. Harvey]
MIAGLVLSFCLVTLTGSALLSLLHLRQDTIRWVALAALVAIGLGLIFPRLEQWLQRPFSRIPHNSISAGGTGFGLGLALGVLYVPCAGPVLTAIILAGATSRIGLNTVVLTCAFALGTALPLLFFALAGRETAGRVSAFRRRQREIRIGAGVVTILLAVALVLNLPATLQRAIPDYTSALQGLPEQVGGPNQIGTNLGGIGGLVTDQNAQLSNCTNGAAQPQDCGSAPDITGISGWLNTPEHQPIRLSSLRGRVVLVDFWAYSCINCQRAIPHVVGWYRAYKDSGLEVIGVHTPEYAFEKVPENVAAGAADLNITYPIALDNNYSTWTNYRNAYWPAEYLIDASGTVRHIKFGEGDYDGTENLIRRLLTDANPGAKLPAPVDAADTTPALSLTPRHISAWAKRSPSPAAATTRVRRRSAIRSRCPRHLRPARPLVPGPPAGHGRRRRLPHQAELPRQERLSGGRWHRNPHRDRSRQVDDAADRRGTHLASNRRRRPSAANHDRSASQQRIAGVFIHLRMNYFSHNTDPKPLRLRITVRDPPDNKGAIGNEVPQPSNCSNRSRGSRCGRPGGGHRSERDGQPARHAGRPRMQCLRTASADRARFGSRHGGRTGRGGGVEQPDAHHPDLGVVRQAQPAGEPGRHPQRRPIHSLRPDRCRVRQDRRRNDRLVETDAPLLKKILTYHVVPGQGSGVVD